MNTLFDKLAAVARKDDPVTSHEAADRLNATITLSRHRLIVLRHLLIFQPCTAKQMDAYLINLFKGDLPEGIAHKRMIDLVNLGMVKRTNIGLKGERLKEMECSLTDAGIEFLRKR